MMDKAELKGKKLLIVEDDRFFGERLSQAMEKRGFAVAVANSVREGKEKAQSFMPDYALVDLRLEDGNGLEVVPIIRQHRADARIVMLTGFGNIATAVAAVKAGAVDYLAKPADVDAILRALLPQQGALPELPQQPMSPERVRWEHIQRVFHDCNENISETARQLGMHRRTLQRILQKHAPVEHKQAPSSKAKS